VVLDVAVASNRLDVSPLYGSSEAVARALRSFVNGKLKAQIGGPDGREYLPFNTMNVPNQKGYKPGTDQNEDLFAGGDPRTNQDWVLLAVHTLLLREHNRICDILISQYSDWDDERLYQTARLVLSSKIQMIANAYQVFFSPCPHTGLCERLKWLTSVCCPVADVVFYSGNAPALF
jgi:peroxidase